jgi:C-terminal processing protease CtpA/Prc
MDQYIKDFPDTRNRALMVKNTLNSSPAFKELKPGDIIWAVNDQPVSASLYILDNAMDNAKESVKLTIYRNGEKLDKVLQVYNIEAHKVARMLNFAGATFLRPTIIVAISQACRSAVSWWLMSKLVVVLALFH